VAAACWGGCFGDVGPKPAAEQVSDVNKLVPDADARYDYGYYSAKFDQSRQASCACE